MNLRYLFCSFIVLGLITSCSQKGDKRWGVINDSNEVKLVIDDIPQRIIDGSTYIDSIKYITLKGTPDLALVEISDVFMTNSFLIVSEYKYKAVYFFDHDGNFIRKIHKRGRGPGEYLSVDKVMVDEPGRQVMMYDGDNRRLLFYDFEGNYVQAIDNFSDGRVIRDMINLPDGGFLCYLPDYLGGEIPAGLWHVDSEGNPGEYLYSMNIKYPLVLPQHSFNLYNLPDGRIGFVESTFSEVYHYSADSLYKTVSYRLPGNNLSDLKGQERTGGGSVSLIMMNSESDDFIITEFVSDKMQYGISIYTKADQTYEVGIALILPPNKDMILLGGGVAVRNNMPGVRTSIIPPILLVDYLKMGKQQVGESLYSFIENDLLNGIVDEEHITDMNPIIQLLYF